MDSTPRAVRTVEVTPLSAREEGLNVIRAAAVIVIAAWIYIANTGPGASGTGGAGPRAAGTGEAPTGVGAPAGDPGSVAAGAAGRDLMPYQKLFASLDAAGQRRFRELREGLLEAENARGASGRWPAAEELARQGVPPFAPGPLEARGRYAWKLVREGLVINYLGLPEAGGRGRPAWLLWIQEPDPLAPADPAPDDETHHRLPDGKVLHVSIWTRAATAAEMADAMSAGNAVRPVPVPPNEGWTQLVAGGAAR
jgi:hypothetical protein